MMMGCVVAKHGVDVSVANRRCQTTCTGRGCQSLARVRCRRAAVQWKGKRDAGRLDVYCTNEL